MKTAVKEAINSSLDSFGGVARHYDGDASQVVIDDLDTAGYVIVPKLRYEIMIETGIFKES